jgi:predicted amidohydrolase
VNKKVSTPKATRVGAIQMAYACEMDKAWREKGSVAKGIEKNVRHGCDLIASAAEQGVQLVGLPEDVLGLAGIAATAEDKTFVPEVVSEVQDWVLRTFQEAARQARMHVVACWYVVEADKMFNVAHLIGPDGQLIGAYRKTHLPPGEARTFSAGDTYPVFETEFGRVAMMICWDMVFPETCRLLTLNGADIIFVPTLGFDFGGEAMGEMRVRVRAFDNAVTIVSASPTVVEATGVGRSCIVGADGDILADAGRTPDKLIFADIDLSSKPVDGTARDGKTRKDMRWRWLRSRRPETYGKMVEPHEDES